MSLKSRYFLPKITKNYSATTFNFFRLDSGIRRLTSLYELKPKDSAYAFADSSV